MFYCSWQPPFYVCPVYRFLFVVPTSFQCLYNANVKPTWLLFCKLNLTAQLNTSTALLDQFIYCHGRTFIGIRAEISNSRNNYEAKVHSLPVATTKSIQSASRVPCSANRSNYFSILLYFSFDKYILYPTLCVMYVPFDSCVSRTGMS